MNVVRSVTVSTGAFASRVTLNGFAGSGASGTSDRGLTEGIGARVPSFRTNRSGPSGRAGGTVSTCSNDDQIHCGRLGVFCAMCSPIRPMVVRSQPPPVVRFTIAGRVYIRATRAGENPVTSTHALLTAIDPIGKSMTGRSGRGVGISGSALRR